MRDWKPKSDAKDDLRRLNALLEDERLTEDERSAFEGMLQTARLKKLTTPQREWVAKAFKKYELDAGEAENLMSSGKVPRGKEVRMGYEMMPRPLKPPTKKVVS